MPNFKENSWRHTHTQPFYGSVEFVRENPGEPVPEETFTHYSHRSHQSSLSAGYNGESVQNSQKVHVPYTALSVDLIE